MFKQEESEDKQEEISEQLEEIAEMKAEKQAKYLEYYERIKQQLQSTLVNSEEAKDYENLMELLDESFAHAIDQNQTKRVQLEKERIFTKEQEKIKEEDVKLINFTFNFQIFNLKTNELIIKKWQSAYKEKLNELISNSDPYNKQVKLVQEAQAYLSGKISTSSVNISGKIQAISNVQCDEHCFECYHYNPSHCKNCSFGFALTENQICTSKCEAGQYQEKIYDIEVCIKCNPVCKECSEKANKCTDCFPNYLLENEECVKTCSTGYYLQDKQCLKCSGHNYCETYMLHSCDCLSCPEGFILKDNKCISECEKEIQFCTKYDEQCNCTKCVEGFFFNPNTQKCEFSLKDCAQYKEALGEYYKDGIYKIYLPLEKQIFDVYCEDGWIVIQRRVESNQSFFQNWNTYVEGFGDLNEAFWLGLDKMHYLTKEPKTLMLDLWYYNEYAYAKYQNFTIGGNDTQYTLHYFQYAGGIAGDSLYYHNNMKFSTYDQDNDRCSCNCGKEHTSGWWFNCCIAANLNGRYGENNVYGVDYWGFKGHSASLTKTVMKIQ